MKQKEESYLNFLKDGGNNIFTVITDILFSYKYVKNP